MLTFDPAITKPELVCHSIARILKEMNSEEIEVAEIDPEFAGGHDLCEKYQIPPEMGANCVIVEGTRGENRTLAACVAPVGHKIHFNSVVRKALNARRVSLAPLDEVLAATGMEYGSITPLGLPEDWKILIDESLISRPKLIIGSGLVKAKLRLKTEILTNLPNALILPGLSSSHTPS